MLEDVNKWYIVNLEISDKGVPEDVEIVREQVLTHMTSSIAEKIELGGVGAVACGEDEENAPDGYYLIRFSSLPFQGVTKDGEDAMMVKGVYYYDLKGAPHWYYQDETSQEADHILEHVVMADIELEDISLQNQPHSRIRAKAYSAKAQKISDESHYKTVDEIFRRERLEYVESRVLVGYE